VASKKDSAQRYMESWNSEERYGNIKILRETVSSVWVARFLNKRKIDLS